MHNCISSSMSILPKLLGIWAQTSFWPRWIRVIKKRPFSNTWKKIYFSNTYTKLVNVIPERLKSLTRSQQNYRLRAIKTRPRKLRAELASSSTSYKDRNGTSIYGTVLKNSFYRKVVVTGYCLVRIKLDLDFSEAFYVNSHYTIKLVVHRGVSWRHFQWNKPLPFPLKTDAGWI